MNRIVDIRIIQKKAIKKSKTKVDKIENSKMVETQVY